MMVKTLEDMIKEKEEQKNMAANVSIFLTASEAKELLDQAQKKINGCFWVLEHLDKQPEEKRQIVKENAEKSAKFWETIANKLEGLM